MLFTLCPSDCSWLLTSVFCQVFLGCTVQPLVSLETFKGPFTLSVNDRIRTSMSMLASYFIKLDCNRFLWQFVCLSKKSKQSNQSDNASEITAFTLTSSVNGLTEEQKIYWAIKERGGLPE